MLEKIVALAHLLIKIRQEIGYRFVQSQIGILDLYGMSSYLMTDIIGAGTALLPASRFIISTQLLAIYRSFAKSIVSELPKESF